jgi:hypothetical protein
MFRKIPYVNHERSWGGGDDAAALSSAVPRAVKLVKKINILNKTVLFSAFQEI